MGELLIKQDEKLYGKREKLFLALMFSFLFGFIAHGFSFANFQLSHDSLDGVFCFGEENLHKIQLGRVFVPVYRFLIRGQLTAPWLTGVLALLWIGIAAYFVIDLFCIANIWHICLVCGILSVNLTVTAICATYAHDLDVNMFALMLNCFAAFSWNRGNKYGVAGGSIAIGIGLGAPYDNYSVKSCSAFRCHIA